MTSKNPQVMDQELIEAVEMLLSELSETARPDGPLDPAFASETMAFAYRFAQDAIKNSEVK